MTETDSSYEIQQGDLRQIMTLNHNYSETVEILMVEIMRASKKANELRKSREASLVLTKLDEARLWLEEYNRNNEQ